MIEIILLASSLLFGLVLLATGVVLLIKLKNKIAGMLVIALGLFFSALPIVMFSYLMVVQRVQG
ncbi:MAG: hypothetical protein ACM3H7_08945 [Acidobacteriaceae bacterium]